MGELDRHRHTFRSGFMSRRGSLEIETTLVDRVSHAETLLMKTCLYIQRNLLKRRAEQGTLRAGVLLKYGVLENEMKPPRSRITTMTGYHRAPARRLEG